MTFVKALCVLLLLYYASFGESERLENDSISKKAQLPNEEQKQKSKSKSKSEYSAAFIRRQEAYKVGMQLVRAVRFVTGNDKAGKLISFSHQRNRDGVLITMVMY